MKYDPDFVGTDKTFHLLSKGDGTFDLNYLPQFLEANLMQEIGAPALVSEYKGDVGPTSCIFEALTHGVHGRSRIPCLSRPKVGSCVAQRQGLVPYPENVDLEEQSSDASEDMSNYVPSHIQSIKSSHNQDGRLSISNDKLRHSSSIQIDFPSRKHNWVTVDPIPSR